MIEAPVFSSPPLHRTIETRCAPLSAYRALYEGAPHSFLYESLEGGEVRGRYSFVGGRPRLVFTSKGDRLHLMRDGSAHSLCGDPLETLRSLLGPPLNLPAVTPFPGGAVGYLGYDVVRFCESLPDDNADDLHVPDAYLVFPEEVIAFDHAAGQVHVFVHDRADGHRRLDELAEGILAAPTLAGKWSPDSHDAKAVARLQPNRSRNDFERAVHRAKQYITAGDIFQVVLSQRFDAPTTRTPLQTYAALRCTNPSPYMYFLAFDGLHVLGSSPEILVKVENGVVSTRPLAGTRPRGLTERDDRRLADDLLADEKERAEHAMLVDLARNDIGRVCARGSVRTTELFQIERYRHVMHLVSHVEGTLAEDKDAMDVVRATFPAGTVSGAPKVRAMEIIEELEPVKRGIYAGAIGYFSLSGDLDLCIAIRTIVLAAGRAYIQAGAGVVADSIPRREYEETLHKAAGMTHALGITPEITADGTMPVYDAGPSRIIA